MLLLAISVCLHLLPAVKQCLMKLALLFGSPEHVFALSADPNVVATLKLSPGELRIAKILVHTCRKQDAVTCSYGHARELTQNWIQRSLHQLQTTLLPVLHQFWLSWLKVCRNRSNYKIPWRYKPPQILWTFGFIVLALECRDLMPGSSYAYAHYYGM